MEGEVRLHEIEVFRPNSKTLENLEDDETLLFNQTRGVIRSRKTSTGLIANSNLVGIGKSNTGETEKKVNEVANDCRELICRNTGHRSRHL